MQFVSLHNGHCAWMKGVQVRTPLGCSPPFVEVFCSFMVMLLRARKCSGLS